MGQTCSQQNTQLPPGIQQLLTKMFARDTGFSGPQIFDFFSQYSLEIGSYPWAGSSLPRAYMFEKCLTRFDLEQQKHIISDLLDYDGPMKHGRPSAGDVERIRDWLGPTPIASPPPLTDTLNWTYVKQTWTKASERIRSDPSGAITSARSLLESVCMHILDRRGKPYDKDGDLQKLYRATSRALTLSPDQQAEDVFRQVLGGCATVAIGLAGMRNQFSDAHGQGQGDAEAEVRHARLAVNAACTIAQFLIETHLAQGE